MSNIIFFEPEGPFNINDLSDFSSICNGIYISSSKGDVISTFDPSTAQNFSNVIVSDITISSSL